MSYKIGPIKYCGNLPWLKDNTILFVKHGSQAYGLATETSDLDLKGIAIPPKEYYFGLTHFEQADFKDKEQNAEAVIYEMRKFINLAAACNPNIIEILWVDPDDVVVCNKIGETLLNNKEKFLSKKARFTFSGYAFSQLKRIKNHYKWINYGKGYKKPERKDFGISDEPHEISNALKKEYEAEIKKQLDVWNFKNLQSLDEAGRIEILSGISNILAEMKLSTEDSKWVAASRKIGLNDNLIEILKKEKSYQSAKQEWDAYNSWKNNRNPDRFELENKFGYDTKHASHLVRLMRMCEEILDDHKVYVRRPDREELLAIRNGSWSYDQLLEFAEYQEKIIEKKYKTSTLKHTCDFDFINKLAVELIDQFYSGVGSE